MVKPHLLLLAQFFVACSALRAKWTPAADGGPARFSKRYRDAAGIDDSQWYSDGQDDWWVSLFPSTPQGWMLACFASVAIYFLWNSSRQPSTQGATLGGSTTQRGGAGEPASEAARAAFLKRYG